MDSRDRFVYVLVIVENFSNSVCLRPARVCITNFTAMELDNLVQCYGFPDNLGE